VNAPHGIGDPPVAEPVTPSTDRAGGHEEPSFDEFPAWTVLPAAAAIMLVAGLVGAMVVGLVKLNRPPFVGPPTPFTADPAVGLAYEWANKLAGILLTCLAAGLSSRPWRERLGLVRGRLPAREYACVAITTSAALALGSAGLLAVASFHTSSPLGPRWAPLAARLIDAADPSSALPLVFVGSVVTGLWEECLFRGYLQRGLLGRWHPVAAIALVAVWFAVEHGPRAAVVLPIAVYLGWLAWRTQSILPGVVAHVTLNAAMLGLRALARAHGAAATDPNALWPSAELRPALGPLAAGSAIVSVATIVWGLRRVARATLDTTVTT
jgi:membrane protease YdiL (CAAX protease family)